MWQALRLRDADANMSRIVVIEDDRLMRALLIEWLSAEGYQVDGIERVPAGTYNPADLVIIDVYMPRDTGIESVCRARKSYPQVPIIAISGQFTRAVRTAGPAAQALGVARVIAKPFDRQTLIGSVRAVLGVQTPDAQRHAETLHPDDAER
jgi:DNA-binding response OmpR family regulator